MTTMACGVGWLHTAHDWVYQGRVVHPDVTLPEVQEGERGTNLPPKGGK